MAPPRFLFIPVTSKCNLKCQHCFFWKTNDDDMSGNMPLATKGEIIREFAELNPTGTVVTCGGEGMLDPADYFGICRQVHEVGLKLLSVVNGTLITTGPKADRMIIEGPDEISVSLDGHTAGLHDYVRGVPGSFDLAVRALRLLISSREMLKIHKPINVMYLVTNANYLDLAAAYDFALNDIGADKMKINLLQPSFCSRIGEPDPFFDQHRKMDVPVFMRILCECHARHGIDTNPAWLEVVEGYTRWLADEGPLQAICNSFERNIMVSPAGTLRFCFRRSRPALQFVEHGDLRRFWESSTPELRFSMSRCARDCGISHSHRRESCTLTGCERFK